MTDWPTPRAAPYAVRRHEPLRECALDREAPLRRLDWILILAVPALCTPGALLVCDATKPHNGADGLDPNAELEKDLLDVSMGFFLGAVAALVDDRTIRAYTPVVYFASLAGLVLVLVRGVTVNGSHSWIKLAAGFEVQPPEFAKIARIIAAAMRLGEKRDGAEAPDQRDVWLTLALACVPILLILKQPDVGTVMVIGFVIFGVIAISGVSSKWILGMIGVALIGAVVIMHLHLLKQYQIDRFTSFTNPH